MKLMIVSKGVRLDVYPVRVVLPPTRVGGPTVPKQMDNKKDSTTSDSKTTLLDLFWLTFDS